MGTGTTLFIAILQKSQYYLIIISVQEAVEKVKSLGWSNVWM